VNAPHLKEILTQVEPVGQGDHEPHEFDEEIVLQQVWMSRFGQILIEVRDGVPFVNGDAVELSGASTRGRSPSSLGDQS
jgi:hypothetical protein